MTPLEAAEGLWALIENKTQCFHREMVGAQQAIALLRQVLKDQAGKDTLAKARHEQQEAKRAAFLKGKKTASKPAVAEKENPSGGHRNQRTTGKKGKRPESR